MARPQILADHRRRRVADAERRQQREDDDADPDRVAGQGGAPERRDDADEPDIARRADQDLQRPGPRETDHTRHHAEIQSEMAPPHAHPSLPPRQGHLAGGLERLERELDGLREDDTAGGVKIGTTRRGIGPAYEDKIGRRAIRVCDLADATTLGRKVDGLLGHHNALRRGFGAEEVNREELLKQLNEIGEKILPYAAPVWRDLDEARRAGFTEFRLQVQYVLGELEARLGLGRERLQSLQKDAAARGYALLVRKSSPPRS